MDADRQAERVALTRKRDEARDAFIDAIVALHDHVISYGPSDGAVEHRAHQATVNQFETKA